MQPRELPIQLLHIRRCLWAIVSRARTTITGKADVGIVGILALFFFQLESRCQKPMEQMRSTQLSCHVTYLLVAGPNQTMLSACEMITTHKVYAWETSGAMGRASCAITVL